ncbi:hypothetical protein [Leucobacter chinensis]|uniref:hypothetical protein n=1 Tax=Leucobacter chinensis TaxID=2851010 RepID=UPI001C21EE7F|nr:hypothetical protein [Leucobacter chinensis]
MSEQSSFKVTPKMIIALLFIAIGAVFIFSNSGDATMHFFGVAMTMPGWLWVLLLLAIGVIIGSFFPWFQKRKK